MSIGIAVKVYDDDCNDLICVLRNDNENFESELKDFVKGFVIYSGIPSSYNPVETPKAANGMGCFAAQLIARFKNVEFDGFISQRGRMNRFRLLCVNGADDESGVADCWRTFEIRKRGSKLVIKKAF